MTTYRNDVRWVWCKKQGSKLTADPLHTRLGKHFLLWDFMFNDSMIRRGFRNVPSIHSTDDIKRATVIRFVNLITKLYEKYGPISISYGVISIDLSKKIVKWKDPNNPSYHRWDYGISSDFIFHDHTSGSIDAWENSPAHLSLNIQEELSDGEDTIDRIITYSESQGICIAVPQADDVVTSKYSNYYYTYEGSSGEKPIFFRGKVNGNAFARAEVQIKIREVINMHGWKGKGYPTYHGGGTRQYHHIRLGNCLMLSDVLRRTSMYCADGWVPYNTANRPPKGKDKIHSFRRVAKVFDDILTEYYKSAAPGALRITPLMGYKGEFDRLDIPYFTDAIDQGSPTHKWHGGGYMAFAMSLDSSHYFRFEDVLRMFQENAQTKTGSTSLAWWAGDMINSRVYLLRVIL